MEQVDDLNALVKRWAPWREVIVLCSGGEGTRFLDLMRYTDRLGKILCLVTLAGNNMQRCDHRLPVVRLSYLPHFRDTALFVVVAPISKTEEFRNELTKFGCKNIIFCSALFHERIKYQLNDLVKSGHITLWTSRDVLNRMDRLEYIVAEQNEVSAVHTKSFAEYRNCFRDKEVALVATGPTLKYYKPIPGAIHIGVNFAWRREDIPLDFLFAQDWGGNRREIVNGFDKIKQAIFIGKYFDMGGSSYLNIEMNIESRNEKIRRYYPTRDAVMGQTIYQDITNHGLADFWTVASPALHFALYTCPKKIYIVGCDTTSVGHFYDKGELQQLNDFTNKMKFGYSRFKTFASMFYKKTEIVSINPVGLKGLFKDIYTDEYKASLEEKAQENTKTGDAQ